MSADDGRRNEIPGQARDDGSVHLAGLAAVLPAGFALGTGVVDDDVGVGLGVGEIHLLLRVARRADEVPVALVAGGFALGTALVHHQVGLALGRGHIDFHVRIALGAGLIDRLGVRGHCTQQAQRAENQKLLHGNKI